MSVPIAGAGFARQGHAKAFRAYGISDGGLVIWGNHGPEHHMEVELPP